MQRVQARRGGASWLIAICFSVSVHAGLPDLTELPNDAGEGIRKSLAEQVGAGRGNSYIDNSSASIIAHDPFRSVRRGRQLFQRKFSRPQGQGPLFNDGSGDINKSNQLAAGLGDSCASCHGRPRGSAGFGGEVATQPDSRDAPHLFGLGLKEMIGDEITQELRRVRASAIASAKRYRRRIGKPLYAKGIYYGWIVARPDGSVDTSQVQGVNSDLRVRPFFHDGRLFSIREFVVVAFQNELGLQPVDPDLQKAASGQTLETPTGMVLDGRADTFKAPLAVSEQDDPDRDGVSNEIPQALIDHMEMYLLNYFKPATYQQTKLSARGEAMFAQIGCTNCHIPDFVIDRDRRVADVDTRYDASRGGWNHLFATATPLVQEVMQIGSDQPTKLPLQSRFEVKGIYTDFKRHDLGPGFYERQYDGTIRKEFMTTPLWGVGGTGPYGHDGRSINLTEVILRHGGEAERAKTAFTRLSFVDHYSVLEFLNTLILFPPDDTSSNLNPGDPTTPGYPQKGHGSIKLPVLFNNPQDLE